MLCIALCLSMILFISSLLLTYASTGLLPFTHSKYSSYAFLLKYARMFLFLNALIDDSSDVYVDVSLSIGVVYQHVISNQCTTPMNNRKTRGGMPRMLFEPKPQHDSHSNECIDIDNVSNIDNNDNISNIDNVSNASISTTITNSNISNITNNVTNTITNTTSTASITIDDTPADTPIDTTSTTIDMYNDMFIVQLHDCTDMSNCDVLPVHTDGMHVYVFSDGIRYVGHVNGTYVIK